MKNPSLKFKLSVNILVALLSVISIISVFVVHRANVVSKSISEQILETYLDRLVKSIVASENNKLYLKIPGDLKLLFSSSHDNIYIIKSSSGENIWTSHPDLRPIASTWSIGQDDETFVTLDNIFSDRGAFYGISREYDTKNGKFMALVAQYGDKRDFAEYILSEFLEDIAWVSPLFILLLVGTVIVTIKVSLGVLSRTSEKAAAINPKTIDLRLAIDDLPREIVPLVEAVNHALDRLEAGFSAERRFTANAAHELRTPLAILKARIDNLADVPTREALNELKRDVERMARVVAQLLAIVRLEMPRPERRAIVMSDMIKDVVSALAPLAVAKQQDLSASLPPCAPRFRGDYAQLYEAIRNLVENAIQYCPSGAGIAVSLDDTGSVRVADNGPGIPDSDKDWIFERFFRGNRTTPSSNGAGLGLSIVRDIAHRYGGSVAVEDTPGGGATFVLILPIDPA